MNRSLQHLAILALACRDKATSFVADGRCATDKRAFRWRHRLGIVRSGADSAGDPRYHLCVHPLFCDGRCRGSGEGAGGCRGFGQMGRLDRGADRTVHRGDTRPLRSPQAVSRPGRDASRRRNQSLLVRASRWQRADRADGDRHGGDRNRALRLCRSWPEFAAADGGARAGTPGLRLRPCARQHIGNCSADLCFDRLCLAGRAAVRARQGKP